MGEIREPGIVDRDSLGARDGRRFTNLESRFTIFDLAA